MGGTYTSSIVGAASVDRDAVSTSSAADTEAGAHGIIHFSPAFVPPGASVGQASSGKKKAASTAAFSSESDA